jgi:hypothetical protein
MALQFLIGAILSTFVWTSANVVLAIPAPQNTASPTASATPSNTSGPATGTATSAASTSSSSSSSTLTRYNHGPIHKLTLRDIVLIVVFVLLPLGLLWFCCGKKYCCFRRRDKREPYNAAYPTQIPGGVFLVPVNQFVPDDPKTGYAVRVDTPANPTEAATPAPPVYHGVILPPRAASPPGKTMEKNGGWKSLFKS